MKSDEVYRAHILDAIAAIERYIEGLDAERFQEDSLRRDDVVRQLMIIGEASGRLSESFLDRYPEVPWHQIRGMRNRLVHDYINVNWDLVWSTVERRLPALREQLASAPNADTPDLT